MLQAITTGNLGSRRRLSGEDALGLLSSRLNGTFDLNAPLAAEDEAAAAQALGLTRPVVPVTPATVTPAAPVPGGVPFYGGDASQVNVAGTGAAPRRPDFGAGVAAIRAQQPTARSTRDERLIQTIAALGGLAGTVIGGPEQEGVWGGLSALGAGVAQGAGGYADRIQAEDAARRNAWQTALSEVMQRQTAAEASAYGNELQADTATSDRLAANVRAQNSNQTTRDVATMVLGGQNDRAMLSQRGAALADAVAAADPEGAATLAAQMGLDPDAARSAATAVGEELDRAAALKGRALDNDERRTVIAGNQVALGWANLNADTSLGWARIAEDRRQFDNTPHGSQSGNAFDDWRDLTSLRGRIGADTDGISQADYDVAERLYQQRWGRPPQAQPGNFSRLFGMVPDADALEGFDLTDPAVRSVLEADPRFRSLLP